MDQREGGAAASSEVTQDRGRRRLWIAAAIVAAIHLALVAYSFPLAVVFGDAGYNMPDYHTHYQQVRVLLEIHRETGNFWAYDPGLLAGEPAGLFFDVDNKAHFLWVWALTSLGAPVAAAFNLFALVSVLVAPLSIAAAARLLSYDRIQTLVATALAVLLWHFDSTVHFVWKAGMISFATASHLAVLCFGLLYATLRGPRPGLAALGLAIALPITHLCHVWSFAILVVPLGALYLVDARRLSLVAHLRVLAAVVATLVVNSYWLLPALLHLDWLADSARVGQATPLYVLADYFEVLLSPVTTGFTQPRTLFRCVALIGAVATLIGWRRGRDRRFGPALVTLTWLFGLAYVGALVPLVQLTEPYRFAVTATLFAGLFATPWLAEVIRRPALRSLPPALRGPALIVALVVIPRIFETVQTFVPELARSELAVDFRGHPLPWERLSMRLKPLDEDVRTIGRVLAELPGEGRVLVNFWPLGEYLRGEIDRPVIGGFPDRRVIHEAANIFRLRADEPRYTGEEFAAYLERYAIEYLVFSPPFHRELETRHDLLELTRVIGANKIYRVRRPSSYVVGGRGEVEAGYDRLTVRGARADDGSSVVLRFHYMEGMVCEPECRVERAPIPFDPVGFVRVIGAPSLPASFVVTRRGP